MRVLWSVFLGIGLAVGLASPAAAAWSAPLTVEEDASADYAVAASPGPDASVVFAWTGRDGRAFTRVRSGSGTLGPVEPLAAAGRNVQIALDMTGRAFFAWLDRGGRVRARVRTPAGAMGPAETISGEDAAEPRVGVTDGGDAVFAWLRAIPGTSPTEYRLQMRARAADGTWSSARTLRSGALSALGLGVDPLGNAVAAWAERDTERDLSRIWTRVRRADGTLGDVRALSRWRAAEPRVAVDRDGTAVFTWTRRRGGFTVLETRTLSAAGVPGPLAQLSEVPADAIADFAYSPDVGVDGKGNAIFGWLRNHGTPLYQGRSSVHVRLRSNTGELGPLQTFVTGGAVTFTRARIAVDTIGNALFAWRRETTSRVEVGFRAAAGALSIAGLRSNACGSPDVAIDADGNAVVLYAYGISGCELVVQVGP